MRSVDEPKETRPASAEAPPWVEGIFARWTEPPAAADVLAEMDAGANRLAPNTRRLWRGILFLQGLAALVPLLWLAAPHLGLSLADVAVPILISVVLVLCACWWLRWRRMRHGWSRMRLVAEIARARMATAAWEGVIPFEALTTSPRLQSIPLRMGTRPDATAPQPWESARDRYLEERWKGQQAHYATRREEALVRRRRLSRWITHSLDAALFLAVAGLVTAFFAATERWMRLSGAEVLLAAFGAALPVAALVYQCLGASLELDRRIGVYQQQLDFLAAARDRLRSAASEEAARAVVLDVERILLTEVAAWHYQMESAQAFYRARADTSTEVPAANQAAGWAGRLLGGVGWGVGFGARVLIGRGLIAALAVVLTTGLIAYRFPDDELHTSMIRVADGRLLSSAAPRAWSPRPERARNGFVLIAHGLRGSTSGKDGEPHWMTRMQEALEARLGERCPDVCLVDWRYAATPSRYAPDGLGPKEVSQDLGGVSGVAGWVQDIARIRPRAQEIGDTVGYKLVRALRKGTLDAKRPMHFIGHSAGGFVVSRAALIIHEVGLAPSALHVTLLDTPMPDVEDLMALLSVADIEFVRTSPFAVGVPDAGLHPRFQRFDITPPGEVAGVLKAHAYAHSWYTETIGGEGKTGFGLSPLAR